MSFFAPLGALLSHVADALEPAFGASATAVTVILLTLSVRLCLHPLSRSAARGERAKAALAPRLAELKRKHGKDPERLRQATAELYAETGVSPLAGCLPMLVQLPVFYVMYHLFSTGSGGDLLDHTLFGAPLGGRWTGALADGGPLGSHGLVYLALFAVVAAVATWTFRRARRTAAETPLPGADASVPGAEAVALVARISPFLSFATLITVAVVPLAAALYVVTTTLWSAVERAYLYRTETGAEAGAETGTKAGGKAGAKTAAKADEGAQEPRRPRPTTG
ncbi:YidC/Oxa1 family membrane protein insertase [Streptomyces huiliensis]|uniref:YidC/Oxa1 family membrane protein insertase n=1 Tax=Streptomyces huiliensis TaxID=2876027 RepID=UPI001CBD132B|nr:membrane protein insertase YidC [Streptomyces huiliensis]MBZ4319268.1 YidC/Oxa1 family membrane protein insertase [Streptomyces huiliensis]